MKCHSPFSLGFNVLGVLPNTKRSIRSALARPLSQRV